MKTNILILLGLMSSGITFSKGLLNDEKLGLVSYLTTVKYMTEYKMASYISAKDYDSRKTESKNIQAQYNVIMIKVNMLINQLSSDIIANNSLCKYRRLNKFVNKRKVNLPKRLTGYAEVLKDIDALAENFLKVEPGTTRALPELAYSDLTGVGTLAKDIITGARDFREKKVSNIAAILKELKLKSISELAEKPASAK
jgi:hypothetical protein